MKPITDANSVEQSWTSFKAVINTAIDRNVPLIKQNNRQFSVPLSKEEQDLVKLKSTLWKRLVSLRKQNRFSDTLELEKEYKSVSNKV